MRAPNAYGWRTVGEQWRTMLAMNTAFVVFSSDMSSTLACGIGSSSVHSEHWRQPSHAQDVFMDHGSIRG